jgi:molybdopterin molybdotransferase
MSMGWEEALALCLRQAAPRGSEAMPRPHALGRILAEDVLTDRDYPAGDLSMMDGYAVAAATGDKFRVQGENTPGRGPGEPLAVGTARRIFTGAELPAGATRVVPQELVEREGDLIRILEIPEVYFVRARGSEARQGAVALSAGTRLGAADLAILASVGAMQLTVTARPRIAHLVTGDEVMGPRERGEPGTRIRDSNSDLVAAVLRGIGQKIVDHRRAPDDLAATIRRVTEMTDTCDFLLVSGGASVGDHDHARPALEAAGFHFEAQRLEVRPGKPVGLARRGSQWAVALPGNPVSHLVAMHLFVLPLLLALEGAPPACSRLQCARLDGTIVAPVPKRDTFWPSIVQWSDDGWRLNPCRFLSSGDLLGIAGANALLLLRAGTTVPKPGEEIFFLSLAPEFSNA